MKILMVGYGIMGHNLEEMIKTTNHEIVGILGKEIGEVLDFNNIKDFDVLIDFSHPSNLKSILQCLVDRKKAGVICTTGLNDLQKEEIKIASKDTAIIYSQNMSIGISIMKKAIKEINKALDYEFDVEIVEAHHNKKLDAPSGTALMLANALKEDHDYNLCDRPHENKRRDKHDLTMHAIRGGGLAGEHSVLFLGEEEYLEVRHVALSRKLFCKGALKAAIFIKDKEKGLYTLDDVIQEA